MSRCTVLTSLCRNYNASMTSTICIFISISDPHCQRNISGLDIAVARLQSIRSVTNPIKPFSSYIGSYNESIAGCLRRAIDIASRFNAASDSSFSAALSFSNWDFQKIKAVALVFDLSDFVVLCTLIFLKCLINISIVLQLPQH